MALDCLRVRELDELDFAFSDVFGVYTTNSFMLRALSYYWLAPRHGIVAQIDSQQYISYQFPGTNAPPDDLGGQAASVERMFEAYHPVAATNPPSTISGFTLTPGSTAFLLQWTTLTGVSSYTVEYATSLAGTINWQALGSTASSFMVDPAPATPGAPVRYYRVAGALGSK